MNAHNMTMEKAVKAAYDSGNPLMMKLVEYIDQLKDEQAGTREDLIEQWGDEWVERVEKPLEEYNQEYYLNSDSDHTNAIVECLCGAIEAHDVERVLDEMNGNELAEEYMKYLCQMGPEEFSELAYDICTSIEEPWSVNINRNIYTASPYCLACTSVGTTEDELEHYHYSALYRADRVDYRCEATVELGDNGRKLICIGKSVG